MKNTKRRWPNGYRSRGEYSEGVILDGFKGRLQFEYFQLWKSVPEDVRDYLRQHLSWDNIEMKKYHEASDTVTYFEGMRYGLSVAHRILETEISSLSPRLNITKAIKLRFDEFDDAKGTDREELARANLSIFPNQLVRNERLRRRDSHQKEIPIKGRKLMRVCKEMRGLPYLDEIATACNWNEAETMEVIRYLEKSKKINGCGEKGGRRFLIV